MPWRSQNGLASGYEENYVEGGAITIQSYLDTHHNGHMEARVCVVSGANSCTTPADFAGNELVFELDLALGGHPPMPKDLKYPERGMYAGGQGGSIKEFAFRYKLPMGIYGENVLFQWKYITANSVSPVFGSFDADFFNRKVSSHLRTYFPVLTSWICCILCCKLQPTQLVLDFRSCGVHSTLS